MSRPLGSRARLRVGAGVLIVAVGAGVIASPTAGAAIPAGGMAASAVAAMFASYGDAGGDWTGGDGTASVGRPDGRVAWLFSDTFLGTVNPDGSRPTNTPLVNNTMVIQEGASLVDTRHGGTAGSPRGTRHAQHLDRRCPAR